MVKNMNWQLAAQLTVAGLLGFVVGRNKSRIVLKLQELKENLLSKFVKETVPEVPTFRFNQTLEEFNRETKRDRLQNQNSTQTIEEFNKLLQESEVTVDELTLEEFNRIVEDTEEEFFDQTLEDFNRNTALSRTSSQFAMNSLKEFNKKLVADKNKRSSTR